MKADPEFEPFQAPFRYRPEEMIERSRRFRDEMRLRRTIRDFSSEPIPVEALEACIEAAASSPSGANRQPWHFVVVTDADVKARIRLAAEAEELTFYTERAPKEWLEALRSLGTDHHKPFLEEAPALIAVFARNYDVGPDGERQKNYYVQESVGIATGVLITALHLAGLATLTHTPSPMSFLNPILNRPKHERAYLLLVVGHPSSGARVPKITKKAASEFITFL